MDKGMFRARRLLTAAAIVALMLVGGVGAAGFTTEDRVAGGPLPETFRLAEARVGDKAEYTKAWVRMDEAGVATLLDEHEFLGYEWLSPEPTRDIEGFLHDTNRLHRWGWQRENGTGEWQRYADPVYALDRNDHAVLSYSYLGGEYRQTDYGEGHTVPCGALSSYHGHNVPLSVEVPLFESCAWPHFKAMGTQRLGEFETILFTSVRRAGPDDRLSMHIWVADGVPFPVRLAVQDQEEPSVWHVLRMTRFERGHEPLVWSGFQPRDKADELVFRPRTITGPSEEGIQHPFPLSRAVALARRDPAGADLDHILAHNGYVFSASYGETFTHDEWSMHSLRSGNQTSRGWSIIATDGQETSSLAITQVVNSNWEVTVDPFDPAPVRQPGQAVVTVEKVNPGLGDARLPTPEDLPKDLPTVASMWAHWQDYAGAAYNDTQPNAWGFVYFACSETTCSGIGVRVGAGLQLSRHWANATGSPTGGSSQADSHDRSQLELDLGPDGLDKSVHEYSYDFRSSAAPAALKEPSPNPSKDQVTILDGPSWVAPAAPFVAASGLLAFLAGLAYLFWPALKSGGLLGLFSRVHSPEELQAHPVRKAMLQMVEANAGIHVRDLQRRLGLGRNQVSHHLGKLRDAGLIRLVAGPGYTCVFLRGSEKGLMASAGALKADAARRILAATAAHPGLSARAAAREAGISPGTLSHHLPRLRQAGLVQLGVEGLFVTELGRRALLSAQTG